jgi:cytochrome c oxidase subunit III
MPGSTTVNDIELIIENVGGGGGSNLPPANRGGGGNDPKRRPDGKPSMNRYLAGMALAIVSVLVFFMALASSFLVLKANPGWIPVHIPALLWLNTVILLASSVTLELARKQLGADNVPGFQRLWGVTTFLGILFLAGQLLVWRNLAEQGIFIATNRASGFFYVFTGAHAVHLIGGIAGLLFVAARNFDKAKITRSLAAEITSYYWHFLDALWIFLLALLYLSK